MAIYFSSQSQEAKAKNTYYKDSISTMNFLNTLNLCEKINYAKKNIQDIVKEKGFSILILQSIAKDARRSFYIAKINGGMIVPNETLEIQLKEQLNDIKLERKCL